jgi:hypothetical protein
MANNIFETTAEVTGSATKVSIKTAANGGRLALRRAGDIARRVQPGYVPPEEAARQADLRRFQGSVVMAGNFIGSDSPRAELEARVSSATDALAARGLAKEGAAFEVRPVMPADTLYYPVMNRQREEVTELFETRLAEDHGVLIVRNTYPITPSEHEGSPVDTAMVLGALSPELVYLSHQMRDKPQKQLTMLALTGPPYTQRIREEQAVTAVAKGDQPARDELLVLEHVGDRPDENWFAEAH